MSHREFTWCLLVLVLLSISINNQNDKIENKHIKFSHNALFRAAKITPEDGLKIQHGRDNKINTQW